MLVQLTGEELKCWNQWIQSYKANGIELDAERRTHAFLMSLEHVYPKYYQELV